MKKHSQIAEFYETGYLVLDQIIPHDHINNRYMPILRNLVQKARARAGIIQEFPPWSLEKNAHGEPIPGFLHKVQPLLVEEPALLKLAKEPLNYIRNLLGRDIAVFATKFFPKLPNGGVSVKWHQDNFYFGTNTDQIVSCTIYLEDSTVENGCLRLIPGSHKSKIIKDHTINTNPHYRGNCVQIADESKAIDIAVPAGTVVLFSPNLLHGSHENNSNKSRYSVAWHYKPTDLMLDQSRFPIETYKDLHILK